MEKLLLLGAEAIAQGAIDGGMSGVYAYPGTPSTEITEYVQNNKTAIKKNIHRNSKMKLLISILISPSLPGARLLTPIILTILLNPMLRCTIHR